MRQQTYFRENLEMISDLFHTIGCHSVLYLWSVIFMKIRPSHYFYILRIVAIFAILLGVTVSATSFISFNLIYSGPTINAIIDIFPYIVFPIQSLLAVIFIVSGNPLTLLTNAVGINFHLKKGTLNASPQTIATLTRLSLMGFIEFLTCCLIIISYFLYTPESVCEPTILLKAIITKNSTSQLFGIALMFIFGNNPRDNKLNKVMK